MPQNTEPRKKLVHTQSVNLWQMVNYMPWGEEKLFGKWWWGNWTATFEGMKTGPLSCTYINLNSEMIKALMWDLKPCGSYKNRQEAPWPQSRWWFPWIWLQQQRKQTPKTNLLLNKLPRGLIYRLIWRGTAFNHLEAEVRVTKARQWT